MSGEIAGQALDYALKGKPIPRAITGDHGTEFQSRALENWAYRRGVQLDFIHPGKPVENAFKESHNGRLRDECLNVPQFVFPNAARPIIETWRLDNNQRRPRCSLGPLPPNEFLRQGQVNQTAEVALWSGKELSRKGPTSVPMITNRPRTRSNGECQTLSPLWMLSSYPELGKTSVKREERRRIAAKFQSLTILLA
ncbi:MAG: integrase core domain-containing protein [Nitrospirales bacterium]